MQQPKSPAQAVAALLSLGATRSKTLANAAFEFAMKNARDQDAPYVARGLSRNPTMRRLLVARVREHFDALEARYAGTFGMVRWIEVCTI